MSIQENTTALRNLLDIANVLPEAGSGEPALQAKTVTPSASSQTVKPDSGYDGLSEVTVQGDDDLVASNIRSGKNIFDVNGTMTEGVTVQRASGTFIPSGDAFTVNVGFQPDLVLLHVGEDDGGGNKMHAAAAFYEDTRDIRPVQIQLPSETGFYMFYIRPQDSGFAGNTWRIDSNWGWNSYGTPVSYVAVKYT